jgi:CDGSH-type Zn-finger protein
VRGDIEILAPDGTVLRRDTRLALCRCGGSEHKPFCDNSHRMNGFHADGAAE